MVGVLNSATTGIQNSTRTIGLQVAHNTTYIASEMAVEISPISDFVTISPLQGTVAANTSLALDASFQSLQIPPGTHTATLTTTHDATHAQAEPIITHATLDVLNDPALIALTSPESETSILQGGSITLSATASDPQGMAKVEFYSGTTKIGEQLAFSPNTTYYSHYWYQPPAGEHTLTAHAIDAFGSITISEPVTFTVHADANSNGIPDWWELLHFGNLDQTADGDFDGDGLSNIWEFNNQHHGFDPTDPSDAIRDTSQNGLPDWWEITHFGAVGGIDASADPDSDGLTNLQEFQLGTNPHNWDTDGDLLPDGWEVQYGLNPLDATGLNGADGDPDGDGLNNFKEMVYGTNPMLADSDGDGVNDGDEINQGSDPNDASDGGQPPSQDEIQPVKIIVGDPSGSQSERWKVEVRDASTQQLLFSHASREYGALSDESDSVFLLRKGKSYTFDLRWIGTDPEVLEWDPDGDFYPDYDWALEISYKDDGDNWVDVTSEDNDRYIVLDPWDPQEQTLAEDNVKLLVNRNELEYPWEGHPERTEQYEQQIATKQVVLLSIEVKVPKIKWANDQNEVQEDEFISDAVIQDKGAFVLLNNDDDNYSGTPDMNDVGEGSELIAIEGPNGELAETDLLPIIIKPIPLENANPKFILDIPAGIRVWREANRSDRVSGKNDAGEGAPTEIDATEESILFIEGIEVGEFELKLDIIIGQQSFEHTYIKKVTVFDIQGPTSVPALGTYEYRIQGASGEWKNPHRGTLHTAEHGVEEKREIEWHHDPGWSGRTGAVVFAPIDGLEWGREVDIVELKLAANPGIGENEVRARNPDTGWEVVGIDWDGSSPGNTEPAVIRSGIGNPHAYRGWVQVQSLKGPMRAGIDHRGVDRLKYGFVQRAKWETKRALYPNNVQRISSLEGMGWHLDRFLEPDNKPWIEDETYQLANSNLTNRRSYYQNNYNTELTNGQLVFHYEFRRGSSFSNSGVREGIMISDQYQRNGAKPTSFKVEGRFDLHISVRTDSSDENADERYYSIANQNNPWRFTAYGLITNNHVIPPSISIDSRPPGQLWGAYSSSVFLVAIQDGGTNSGLRLIKDFNEDHFIAQEYPFLLDGEAEHEQWNDQ